MPERGDEVAERIESRIREAVEKMVTEIRSSVDDVRITVESQLTAALQSIQADVNSVSFGPHIRQVVSEFEALLSSERPEPVAQPAPGVSADASRVKQAIQTVERGKSQVDVLNSMLEQCQTFGSRAALMILKGETFAGWKGVGFAPHGGSDETIKRFAAPPGSVAVLDRLLRQEQVVVWDGADLSARFGVSPSSKAIVVPMVIKDKLAAAVYVDVINGEEHRFDTASIELLVFVTGLLIDTLAIRKKIPSPSLSSEYVETSVAAPEAKPWSPSTPASPASVMDALANESTSRRLPRPLTPAPSVAPMAPMPSDETIAIPGFSLEGSGSFRTPAPPAAPPPPPPPSFATTAIPAFGSETIMAPPPVAPPPPPPPAPAAPPEPAEKSSTQYVPPPGVGRGAAFGGNQTDQAKKHDEARRFARLLVSEIKLYNESKVDQGRKNRDIYDRLKEDIDRSRQMYDERIPEDVRKVSNYFYDELVRILADSNPDALGL